MSRHGVWQLKKLTLHYCKFSGSSRGARRVVEELAERDLPRAPQLALETALVPGGHPYLKANYESGNQRVIGVKNLSTHEIQTHIQHLRDSAGRKSTLKLKSRHVQPLVPGPDGAYVRASPSIQGPWQPRTA